MSSSESDISTNEPSSLPSSAWRGAPLKLPVRPSGTCGACDPRRGVLPLLGGGEWDRIEDPELLWALLFLLLLLNIKIFLRRVDFSCKRWENTFSAAVTSSSGVTNVVWKMAAKVLCHYCKYRP